jgi:hypothetical protein
MIKKIRLSITTDEEIIIIDYGDHKIRIPYSHMAETDLKTGKMEYNEQKECWFIRGLEFDKIVNKYRG